MAAISLFAGFNHDGNNLERLSEEPRRLFLKNKNANFRNVIAVGVFQA